MILHSLILLSELTIWETESPGFISTKSRTLLRFNFQGLFGTQISHFKFQDFTGLYKPNSLLAPLTFTKINAVKHLYY